MQLYDMMKNISGKNNEEQLVKSISNVRKVLNGLTEERMCKVYSSFLLKQLLKNHIPARLVNTIDLNLDYEHLFLLVPSNDTGYFLVDLTFSQFKSRNDKLNQLLDNGYQLIDDVTFNNYLSIISKQNNISSISVDDVFYSSNIVDPSEKKIRK